MRTWEFIEPPESWKQPGDPCEPVFIRMTDGDVLAFYWDYWSGEMRRLGRRGINPENCIQDWAEVHWASVVSE